MIRLRLATEAGIQEITPASLTHCAGCEQEYYLDGPADSDPHDRRTDRRRLSECICATNPVSIELMREAAERSYRIDACSSWGAHEAYDVAFRVHEPRRPLIEFDPSTPTVRHILRFHVTHCECDEHGQFTALLLHGEKPFCPFCIASWEADMRRTLYRICQRALAHLHRQRMNVMAAKEAPLWVLIAPDDTWRLLGPNPSWNPQT